MLSIENGLLAFTFLNPLLLWGVALASIPIILHLLHKRQYQEVEWAAMRFLLQAVEKNSRRIRLEQLLLLIVRVLILSLLAFALAQPFFNAASKNNSTDLPTQRIIVIDTSYSMGQRVDQFSLLDKAKSVASSITETTRPGDTLQLVRISAIQPRAIVQQPALKAEQVLSEIEQLQLTEEWGNIPETLQTVTEMLQQEGKHVRREIYFISDFQRESWLPASHTQQQQIHRKLEQLAESANLVMIDLGHSALSNIALTNLVPREQFLSTGHVIHLQATIRNNGINDIAGAKVELFLDGRLWKTETVNLKAGAPQGIDFQVTFERPGEHFAEVRLSDDVLLVDNHRFVALPVHKELRILLVNGRPAGEPRETATYFLQKALSPSTIEETWTGFTRPFVISEGELPSTDLSLYDTVIFADIGQFTKQETEMIESYARSGGSVIFSLGENVKADQYNQILYRKSKGILPAQLGNNIGNVKNPQTGYQFDSADLSHAIVKPFEGNPGTGLESTLTYRYTKTLLPPHDEKQTKQANVALRFANGDPVIIDSIYGRGRVLLITTSLDTRWGLWAVQRSFPPMIHEMVKYSVSGQWQQRMLIVNESLTETFPTSANLFSVDVVSPDKKTETISTTTTGRFPGISFENTKQSGIYRMDFKAPLNRTKLFAVNLDPRESRLEKISEKEMRQTLLPDLQFLYMTKWQKKLSLPGHTASHSGKISQWLLIAVLCLLLVEQLMAWRFYWGFLMLYGIVAACFIQQVLTLNLVAGVAATLLFGSGFVLLLLHPRREEGV